MPKAYIASPFGFTEAGRFFMYEKFIPLVRDVGFEVLDPWKLTPPEGFAAAARIPDPNERRRAFQRQNRLVGENNARAVQEADVIIAVLDGPDVDSGTAAEIGYAAGLGKPIIGYRGDTRQSGDNEATAVNLQVEYFISLGGGSIAQDLYEITKALREFRSQMP